jgi:hypothetical protein
MVGLEVIIIFLILIFASAALGYFVISKLLNYKFFSESYGIIIVIILGFAICSLPIFICGWMWG